MQSVAMPIAAPLPGNSLTIQALMTRASIQGGSLAVWPNWCPLPELPRPRQELPEVRGGEGAAEQEPLHTVALAGGEELELRLGLHPLRHHAQLQGMGQGDDGGGDGGVIGVARDVAHEGLVDLQGVDGQALEVAQRGVADPEVVDGDPYAQRLELAQDVDGRLRVLHGVALRDLQVQGARGKPRLAQGALDV